MERMTKLVFTVGVIPPGQSCDCAKLQLTTTSFRPPSYDFVLSKL